MGNRMAGKGAMTVLIYEGAHVRMVFTLCFWALHWAGFFFSFFFFLIHGAASVSKTEVKWDMSGGVGRL